MRVCIPIEFRPQGGGYYFLNDFNRYLIQSGWKVLSEIDSSYDVLFTNHWMTPYREIVRAFKKNPMVRVVQRIDGAAQDYGRDPEADGRQRAVNRIADLTIFQSEYCRYSTREKYPVIINDGPVIHNPVDTSLFNPEGRKRIFSGFSKWIVSVTWSTNPMKGASSIYSVASLNPECGFVLCGQFPDAPNLPNIFPLGVLERPKLAEVLRSCHVMLTFSRNEACPNHVLESLASGLPVLYDESGAMEEVIGNCGLPVTVTNFRDQLAKLIKERDLISRRARERAINEFNQDRIFEQYLEALEIVVSSPPRTTRLKRSILLTMNALRHPFG